MKTGIDLIDDTYELLDVPGVRNAMLSGDIFPDGRPDGHKGECIVINTLPVTGDQLQQAVVNVNIHVPNLKLNIDGQPDVSQPNNERLKAIFAAVYPILKDAMINDTATEIRDVTKIPEPNLREHYLNIRVGTYSINI